MPTLKIGDKQVKVGDEFLSLPKDQQQAMVNKIAAQLAAGHADSVSAATAPAVAPTAAAPGGTTTPPPGLVPGSREYADWAAKAAMGGQKLPQVSETPPEWQLPDTVQDVMPAPLRAWSTHTVENVPVLGPLVAKTRDPMMQAIDKRAAAQAPGYATAGDITGAVLPYVAGAATPVLSTILGMDAAAPLVSNVILGGASQKAIATLDDMARGQDPNAPVVDFGGGMTLTGPQIAETAGVLGPVLGKVVPKAAMATGKYIQRTVGKLLAPETTAQKIISNAARLDAQAGAPALSAADEALAATNGQPLINADRFGPNTRTLARTASNLDPAAKQTMSEAVQDRFKTQGARAVDWITRNTGAPVDVHALGQQISDAGRAANKPAYLKAYSDPRAAAVLTVPADAANPAAGDMLAPEIHQLMGAKPFQMAIRKATETGATDSALHGYGPVENPFKFNKDGTYGWAPNAKLPSLQFWDQVQRNLGTAAKVAGRQGDGTAAGHAWQLRGRLNDALDAAVPAFNTARTGAAAKFGAEDALEAGQKFLAADISDIPAMKAAHASFSPAEKRLFASGFSSSLIDKVSRAPDSTNVINTVFNSPRARAQVELALGSKAAENLEHFLRLENIMHLTKATVEGGSNTIAQSAAAAAIGYGTGVGSSGWNFNPIGWSPDTWAKAGGVAGLLRFGKAGAKALGIDADRKVMQSIATSLASNDPSVIARAANMASRSPKSAAAIKAIEHGLSLATRTAAVPALAAAAPQEMATQ